MDSVGEKPIRSNLASRGIYVWSRSRELRAKHWQWRAVTGKREVFELCSFLSGCRFSCVWTQAVRVVCYCLEQAWSSKSESIASTHLSLLSKAHFGILVKNRYQQCSKKDITHMCEFAFLGFCGNRCAIIIKAKRIAKKCLGCGIPRPA